MSKGPVPPDFVRNRADEMAIEQGYYWDRREVERVLAFFPACIRLTSGRFAGKPMTLMPWQEDWLSRLFGWRMPDGRRRFREAFLEMPKKQSKTTLMAALALLMVRAEASAEVYNGAVNGLQAGYLFIEAAKMVKASPGLAHHYRINEHRKIITSPRNFGRMEALTADADAKDGVSSSCTIFDEIHRWGSDQRLYDVMKNAGAARDSPLILMITTAGSEESVFARKMHDRARGIIDGIDLDLAFLPQIHAADESDDIDDPATWYKANPSLGVITREEDFRRDLEEAKRNPTELAKFKRLRLGIWQQSVHSWISVSRWKTGNLPELREDSWWVNKDVVVAIDLSKGANDLTTLSMATWDGKNVCLRSHCFIPEENVDAMAQAHEVVYREWAERGFIELTPGNFRDEESIVNHLIRLRRLGVRFSRIVVDNWYSDSLQACLSRSGFSVHEFPQNIRYFARPVVDFEQRLAAGTLKHCASPLAEWCVGNARTTSDAAGNSMLCKARAGTKKIDSAVSGVMAVGVLTSSRVGTPRVL